MITYCYKSLRSDALQQLDKFQRGAWVYAAAPSEAEVADLINRFKLEPGHLQDALDEDEQPRLEREGDQTYVFVRFAYRKASGEYDTAPLLLIFGPQFVITISPIALPTLNQFTGGRIAFATSQRAHLVLQILSSISDQYDQFVSQTSRRIKSIRSRLRGQGISNQDFLDFATIEDELNEFLASLQPNNATLRRLLAGRDLPLQDDDQDLVEDLLLSNAQSIEASKANLKSIGNIREAYSAISANNLNQTLTFLTVATIIISLPSFAMGIYSMNIRLPFQYTHWIFWVVMGVNVLLMVFVFVVARKKHVI